MSAIGRLALDVLYYLADLGRSRSMDSCTTLAIGLHPEISWTWENLVLVAGSCYCDNVCTVVVRQSARCGRVARVVATNLVLPFLLAMRKKYNGRGSTCASAVLAILSGRCTAAYVAV